MLHLSIFGSARFFIFLSAALLLAIAPGPGMLYVLARTLAGGRREGLLSAFGTFFGGMVHVFAAAAGVSIILAKSAVAFATVKYLGAAYLCFLGIRMIIDSRKDARELDSAKLDSTNKVDLVVGPPRVRNPFWQGVMTEVLNPKTALFFPFLHSSIRGPQQRTRLPAVCSVGDAFSSAQHIGRHLRRDIGSRTARPADR